jgi:hypothetical protein
MLADEFAEAASTEIFLLDGVDAQPMKDVLPGTNEAESPRATPANTTTLSYFIPLSTACNQARPIDAFSPDHQIERIWDGQIVALAEVCSKYHEGRACITSSNYPSLKGNVLKMQFQKP